MTFSFSLFLALYPLLYPAPFKTVRQNLSWFMWCLSGSKKVRQTEMACILGFSAETVYSTEFL